jgi:hypothetical protein
MYIKLPNHHFHEVTLIVISFIISIFRLHMRTLKADRMKIVFGILFVAAFSMSIGCFIAPKAVNFWYFLPFSILFAALFGKGYILRLR